MPRPVVPEDDLYARLEVAPDASSETIEIAWRALLKRHHPDVAGGEGLELAKRINVAHDWLSDRELRARYDAERLHVDVRRAPWTPRTAGAATPERGRTRRRAPETPAHALQRFLDRVARLNADELDRLSVAETTSIAFVASIRRFLSPDSLAAVDAVEPEVRRRLAPRDWANPAIRDAILAAAHEIVLGRFLDEHLSEPFRGRARDRLMRGWEAAVAQPRYGPNSASVRRFVDRARALTSDEARALARAIRGRIHPDPWPPDLDPDEHDGLRVSTVIAGNDAVAAARPALESVDRATASRASRLLRRTAHAMVLGHAFGREDLDALLYAWRVATGDKPGSRDEAARATVRRR
jgi:curved DNA-binding protein CbpA/DNA-binding transcriptional regulator YdaS (Cro superfamily)